jgi:EmrB/QacA subfamily drug resistance transporter
MAFDTVPWLHRLPHPRFPEDETSYAYRWPVLYIVSLGVFLNALDVTIVGVTAPKLSTALGATATQVQWAFDAYTIALGGFVVLGGGLADRYGRKGFVQAGMLVFATGASVCAYAPSIGIFIAGRVVSGLGVAVVFPACLSIISALFLPEERHRAIGIFSTIAAVGIVGGPVIGGILIDVFWWGAAFLFMTPVALLAIVAIAIVVPPSRRPDAGKLDLVGALLSVLGLGGIVFGVIEGPDRGWGQSLVLVPFSLGLICTAGFIFWELRSKTPLFDLRVFQDSRVVGGALSMVVVYFALQSSQLLLPQYLDYVLDLSSLQIGLTMAPFGLGLALFSSRSADLVGRHGQRKMLLLGLALMAVGTATLALLPVWGGIVNVVTGASLYSVGHGLISAPATSAVMVAIPKEKAGDGSAVNMVSRQIGGAVGVAITGSIASMVYRAGLSLGSFPLDAAEQSRVEHSLSGVNELRNQLHGAMTVRLDAMADASMLKGVAAGMGVSALLTLLVAVVVFFAVRRPARAG